MGGGGGGGGGNPPKPPQNETPIADFYIHLGGLRGLNPTKGTDAGSGFENSTTYLSKVRKNKTKMVSFEKSAKQNGTIPDEYSAKY